MNIRYPIYEGVYRILTYEMTTIKNNELIVQLKADNPDWFD